MPRSVVCLSVACLKLNNGVTEHVKINSILSIAKAIRLPEVA